MSFGYSGDKSMLTHIILIYDCVDNYMFSNHKQLHLYLKTALLHLCLHYLEVCTFRLASHTDLTLKFDRGLGEAQTYGL